MSERHPDTDGLAVTAALKDHVIARKAEAARRALEARAMSPSRALRRALSWAADDLWGMALICQGVQSETLDQEDAATALNPAEVLIVLDGPDGAVGLAAIEPGVLAGLVERQTLGSVLQSAIPDRVFTPTDAAMAAPLVDCAMDRFALNLSGHPLADQLSGFRFGAMVEDARAAGLVLDAAAYRGFRVSIDLEHGNKRGDLQLLLPVREGLDAQDTRQDVTPGPHEQTLLLVPAQINAIVATLRLPLAQASALQPGDLLPLPVQSIARTRIMVGQSEMLTRGTLGQINGFRAVRLDLPARTRVDFSDGDYDAQGLDDATMNTLPAPQLPMEPPVPDPPAEPLAEMPAIAPEPAVNDEMPALPDLPDLPEWTDLPQPD